MKNASLSSNLNAIVDEHLTLLLMRIGVGAFMLTHGIPKLMKVFTGDFSFGDPLGLGSAVSLVLAALSEGVGALLVIVGLGTRYASFSLVITMAVAGFIAHGDDPFGTKEKALLFMIFFMGITLLGGGKYSLDNKLFNANRV